MKALEIHFGEKWIKESSLLKSRMQKKSETLKEFYTDTQKRLMQAYASYPANVREYLAVQLFIDVVRDRDMEKELRFSNVKNIRSALEYALKYEGLQLAFVQNCEAIRRLNVQDNFDPSEN